MGTIDRFDGEYKFLSNFYVTPVEYEGLVFGSSENAFQAAKTLDWNIRLSMMRIAPGVAKRRGRTLLLRADWEHIKDDVMLDIVRIKFKNQRLATLLADTGTANLIEGNSWGDEYWGVCRGIGQNKLGKILERVRFEIWEKGFKS